ncbi:MAG: T9SS type A sorting domain-containing protein [candidate division Zixibacteria bacterium]|nr:T9SS type A sorting domain-containing protein [candidate division Zixibacteria bacterium]
MKRVIFSVLSVLLLVGLSHAELQDPATINTGVVSKSDNLIITQIYEPTLDFQFAYSHPSQVQSIACDGEYYYSQGYSSSLETYDLEGNFVRSVTVGFDPARSMFVHEGVLYAKQRDRNLYELDPVTGNTTVAQTDIFHDNESCAGYAEGYFYEHFSGTVWKIDAETGETVETINLNSPVYAYPIATNGVHLFLTDGSNTTNILVFEMDGTYVETFSVTNGSWGWAVSYCNGRFFTADHDNGNWYVWDLGEIRCADVEMVPDEDPVIVPPGGNFGLTGYVSNPNDDLIETDLWVGVIYLGDFFQLWNFSNIPLDPGQEISAHLVQFVPGFAPSGTYIYMAYAGEKPDGCDSVWFEFTVTGSRVDSGAVEWSVVSEFFGGSIMPSEYGMSSNHPNPFNASTTIKYQLPEAGNVNLEVCNLMGQKVATLTDGFQEAGQHTVIWDASGYSSGVYFYKLEVGGEVFTKRMTLLK